MATIQTSSINEKASGARVAISTIPPLENGDHLSRAEFFRRDRVLMRIKKAERIEGIVYMQAAVRFDEHSEPHADVIAWLRMYVLKTPGVRLGDNGTLQLDPDNDVQPDAMLRISPECGGRTQRSDEGYIVGPPELVVEVAASSASIDLHTKFDVYRRSGVQEYLVWDVLDDVVGWWKLQEDQYVPLTASDDGVHKSQVFPGLWLHAASLISGGFQKVIDTLNEGTGSPEHGAFVADLQKKRDQAQ